MKFIKYFLIMSVMSIAPDALALEFSEFAIINLNVPFIQDNADPSFSASGGFSFGGGITLGFTVWKELVVEPGFLYVTRNYSTVSNTQTQTGFSSAIFQTPLVLRYWITPHFSFGFGGYFAHFSGDLTQTVGTTSTRTYIRGQLYEWGLLPTVRLKSPISDLMSAVLDARFLYSLSNSDSSNVTTRLSREVQIWGGISFIL